MGIMLKNVHLLQSPEEERTDVYINGNRISAIGREPRGFSAEMDLMGLHRVFQRQ